MRRGAFLGAGGAVVVLTVTGGSLLAAPVTPAPGGPSTAEEVAAVWRAGAAGAQDVADGARAATQGDALAGASAVDPSAELLAERDGGGTSRSADRAPADGGSDAQAPSGASSSSTDGGGAADPVEQARQQVLEVAAQQTADAADADADASGGSAAATRDAVRASQEQRAAEAAAQALAAAQSDPRPLGALMAAERGWDASQFQCLDSLWTKESNWRWYADNPTSSAYGIPQALPGVRMAAAGADWETNPATQITWGLDYIAERYGTPCSAWSHSRAVNWY